MEFDVLEFREEDGYKGPDRLHRWLGNFSGHLVGHRHRPLAVLRKGGAFRSRLEVGELEDSQYSKKGVDKYYGYDTIPLCHDSQS